MKEDLEFYKRNMEEMRVQRDAHDAIVEDLEREIASLKAQLNEKQPKAIKTAKK